MNSEFLNFEYEVHQVSLKDSGSQNFSFRTLKRKAVGVVKILRTVMEMARDKTEKKSTLKHVH
jgi:EAL domain-containing protein (putative c-di-GMP-specific phosphodiesterase class I)